MTPRRAGIAVLALALLFVACAPADAEGILDVPPSADADRGKAAIRAYGCGSCHSIPGVSGANGRVGPPLDDFGTRYYIAGAVPNNFENLVQWIMAPDSIEPGTIMPILGVSEEEAADIAAYLATLN